MSVEIFASNYRGFRDLRLSMDRNLFLVGDNSSGKSSILHLIGYVYSSELLGPPKLDERHAYDPFDFFSPYFDYADVTIGYLSREKKTFGARVITLQKAKDFNPPVVKIFTTIYGTSRITLLRKSTGSIWFKVSVVKRNLAVSDLEAIQSERTGFKKLELDEDDNLEEDEGLNSPGLPYTIMRQFNVDEETAGRIVRGSGMGFLPSAIHSGPLRGLPARFYTFERKYKTTGAHFASMWHDMQKDNNAEALQIVRQFGRESLLFEDLNVERVSKKIPNSPLIVTVKKRGKEFLLNQVGVGISQVIPVIIESVFTRQTSTNVVMLLQQPELHLHPIAQAALGEFLFKMSESGLRYVVETHSDFLIDRFRSNIRERESTVGATILFCENREDGNYCHPIGVNSRGELENPPDNYKDFFVNELMRTMF